MSEGIMSSVLHGFPSRSRAAEWEEESPISTICLPLNSWNPQKFARAQIRGLVRQVFSVIAPRPVRQVVFTAVDAETEVRDICLQVAEALALETLREVAIVGSYLHAVSQDGPEPGRSAGRNRNAPLREAATPVQKNLWLLPVKENDENYAGAASLQTYLGEIRGEFTYSIVAAPAVEESNEALALAQFADGVILVLSAQRTRRVTARKIKEKLEQEQVRVLGVVLSDRAFPIPAGIYRRL